MCVSMYVPTYASMYVCLHICIFASMYVAVFVCMCIVRMHVLRYETCTYMYLYIHIPLLYALNM